MLFTNTRFIPSSGGLVFGASAEVIFEGGLSSDLTGFHEMTTHRLLLCAALIMSVFLIASRLMTTLLIPAVDFRPATETSPAGPANGRALAYLAHLYLGDGFGTHYDVSTILILWFAGASAMAGLLNIVPRYLPRYGLAPEWAAASRPLVLIYTAIAFAVTIIFQANVDAQATGVLVLMSSAAIAVTLSARRNRSESKWPVANFAIIAAIFLYTTVIILSNGLTA